MSIIIWGDGRELENFIFELETSSRNVDINCIATDNDYYFLKRYNVKTEKEVLVGRTFQFTDKFVIATSDKEYLDRKRRLEDLGYREFDDFVGYRFFNKKICLINANCYMLFIKKFLNENAEFRSIYGIYPLPPIHENTKGYIGDAVLSHADLYIHQNIRLENMYGSRFSDEYTLSKLKSDCKTICIPNFVGALEGFFPTITGRMYNNVNGKPMCFDDWLINEAYERYNGSIDNIMFYIEHYHFDREEVLKNFNAMVEKWREREQKWDVKIVDFILENYQRYYMFEDISHPADCLQHEISRRVLKAIGCTDINRETHYHMGCCMEIFMWPQIREILGINWRKSQIRLYTSDYCYHDSQPINIRQYVQEYIWRVFKNK